MRWLALALGLALAACAAPDHFLDGQNAFARGDLNAAYESFRAAAEGGDAKAARALGLMLETGVDVTSGQKLAARPEEAARWYRQAADAGDKDAAQHLGMMYAFGRGVPVDYAEAVRLLGPPSAEWVKKDAKYAPAERAEIHAWLLALHYAMERRSKELRHDFSEGASVEVWLRAKDSTVTVKSARDASERVRDAVVRAAREALADAPPTPAARTHAIVTSFTIDFRYKD